MTKVIKRPAEPAGNDQEDRSRGRASVLRELVQAPQYRRQQAWEKLAAYECMLKRSK